MDYLNQKELKCGLEFMAAQEHTRNGKKFLAQNKWEGNVSLAPLFSSKIRAGSIAMGQRQGGVGQLSVNTSYTGQRAWLDSQMGHPLWTQSTYFLGVLVHTHTHVQRYCPSCK